MTINMNETNRIETKNKEYGNISVYKMINIILMLIILNELKNSMNI